MHKQFALYLWSRLVIPDFLLIAGSFVAAYFLRFSTLGMRLAAPSEMPVFSNYAFVAVLAGLVWCFFLSRKGEYSYLASGEPNRMDRYVAVQICNLKTQIFLLAFFAVFREFLISRYVHLLAFLIAGGAVIVWREVVRVLITKRPIYRVLLIDVADSAEDMRARISERIRGILSIRQIEWQRDAESMKECFSAVCQEDGIDTVFMVQQAERAPTTRQKEVLFAVLNICESKNIAVYMISGFFDVLLRREEMYSFTNMALIRLRDASLHPMYYMVKRSVDIIVSLLLLLIGFPFWLAIALVVKLQDGGPVFYRQCRIGLHGKPFDMLKFRTMRVDADRYIVERIASGELDESMVFNIRNDHRVTPVGQILRRLSLDEIPQIINVICGDMSLVGPRPERRELVEKYSPFQRRRLKALPGITGLQQVMSRGDPSLERRIEYDLLYISKQCLLIDLYILLRTVDVVVRGAGLK